MPLITPSGNFIQLPYGIRQGLHFGPPIEEIIIEITYFLLIFIISIYIYFKTKEIYELTKHKGIYYFRHIFLYFALAYFFRLNQIIIMLSREFFSTFIMPRIIQSLNFFFVSYFSNLAIMSLILSFLLKNLEINEKKTNIILHLSSFILSFFAFIIFSNLTLLIIQTAMFIATLIMLIITSCIYKKEKIKFLTQNKITYFLLIIFWILSTLSFIRRLIPREIKIPLYLVSAGVFLSIFLRVRKRFSHAEKKRPT